VLLLNECLLLLFIYRLGPEIFGYNLVNEHLLRFAIWELRLIDKQLHDKAPNTRGLMDNSAYFSAVSLYQQHKFQSTHLQYDNYRKPLEAMLLQTALPSRRSLPSYGRRVERDSKS
jgi:hypothetical protein